MSCYAFGQGIVDVNILNDDKSVPITLSKVLYVPELHKHLGAPIRLLSWTAIRMIAPLSELHSTSTADVIRLPDKSKIKLHLHDSLMPLYGHHRLPISTSTTPQIFPHAFAAIGPPLDHGLWHARLGHLSYRTVHDLAKLKMITSHGNLQTVPFCDSCALVKRKAAPIPRTLHPRSDIPFSHVGIDF